MNNATNVISQLRMELGQRSYPIIIGCNLLKQSTIILESVERLAADQIIIISNKKIASIYLHEVLNQVQMGSVKINHILLEEGEATKNWNTVIQIIDFLVNQQASRKSVLIALGGGVIGDITGFAASIYMRGIPFIQIPTTLLAQVDSSVGGKTGINHPLAKNMIGSFYQPLAVIIDTKTLSTLPQREVSAGLAEVIKYGMIYDAEFFAWLEQNIDNLLQQNETALAYAIERCCAIKAAVVAEDERESALRAILNFGHTFGHAIEAFGQYRSYLHGEAVAIGMLMALHLSMQINQIDQSLFARAEKLLARAKLPIKAPQIKISDWINLMQFDKKNEANKIRFVLLKELGKAYVSSVPEANLLQTLNYFGAIKNEAL